MSRTLSIALEAVEGTINRFYAFADGRRIVAANGSDAPKWSGEVGPRTKIRLRVWGIADASFKFSIDLPGTAEDQDLTLRLDEGYHESDYVL